MNKYNWPVFLSEPAGRYERKRDCGWAMPHPHAKEAINEVGNEQQNSLPT